MGEIADMYLDGTLCQVCGTLMEDLSESAEPLEGDEEGRLNVSKDGIIERDELVFSVAREHKVPVCMLLSGGYTSESSKVIVDSLKNLIEKEYIDC